ncbi:Uncharacterised protein [Mycobacteroides abscessus subsp. abscessus]|nr:Uncharacterised protein [Mycobacteroides abscessus subsp. abscessus]
MRSLKTPRGGLRYAICLTPVSSSVFARTISSSFASFSSLILVISGWCQEWLPTIWPSFTIRLTRSGALFK